MNSVTARFPLLRTGIATTLRQWLRQTRLEITLVFKSGPFFVLLFLGVVFVIGFALEAGSSRGTPAFPLTHLMLQAIKVSMHLVLTIIVVFYGGEMIHRDRSLGIHEIINVRPVCNGVLLLAKLTALGLVVLVFMFAGLLSTISVQVARGYFVLEPGLYARGLAAAAVPFVLIAVLGLFVQVLVDKKLVGYLLVVLVLVSRLALPALGWENNLYRYAGLARMQYSDMNGFGHFVEPFLWYCLYWGFAAVILVLLSLLFWVRGTDSTLRIRLALARARMSPAFAIVLTLVMTGMASTGAYINFNTKVVGVEHSRRERYALRAAYEKQYRAFRELTLPRVVSVEADVDLFPKQRDLRIRGRYHMVNDSHEPITLLPITMAPRNDHVLLSVYSRVELTDLQMGGHRFSVHDSQLGFYVVEFLQPIAPGETREFGFEVAVSDPGFKSRQSDTRIVANGSFFANRSFFPMLGYIRTNELHDTRQRQLHDLPRLERMPAIDDVVAHKNNYLHADWIEFDTTVSTTAGQTAIAPGALVEQWEEGQRVFFRYRTQAPIINLFVYMSAEYEVRREMWNGVAIEVYYHPGHSNNVDRIMKICTASLAYYSSAFGEYPHRQLRIVEVPRYIGLTAFALAGTIPFSEAFGFTQMVRDGDVDMVSNITAHEIAHQWWNHQVIGADVQGATMISEALAEYSALIVMEKMYGVEQVRHFLRYELDQYLQYRGFEQLQEMPLMLVEDQQYIHYNKGAMVMYRLRDLIGEEAVNRALRRFLETYRFQGPPFPTSKDLLTSIRGEVPKHFDHLVEDLFETITLYDNRLVEATWRAQSDGTYLVNIDVRCIKLRADGGGAETEIKIDDWIDVVVFGAEEKILLLEKRHITERDTHIEVVVSELPLKAGVDPYNIFIDRNVRDNFQNTHPTG